MSKVINDRIIELLHRRLQQHSLNEAEVKELEQWIRQSPDNSRLFEELTNEQSFNEVLQQFSNVDTEASLQKVRRRIFEDKQTAKVRTLRTIQIPQRYVAAAIILILFTVLGIFYFPKPGQTLTAENKTGSTNFTDFVAPGGDKTRLTLSNGSRSLDLDNSRIGDLVIEESAIIIHGEKLPYAITKANNTAGEVMFNTLANPRGLKQKVVLPDKSVVWLNSLSVIRFPNKFAGNERRIQLMGEAEFEITKNTAQPFIVQVVSEKGEEKNAVTALGTHFIVTAYDNENTSTTTLVEGSVEVVHNNKADTLKPGQQAIAEANKPVTIKNVDANAYLKRKNGEYTFKDVAVTTIMNQAQRMYNVKVVYKNESALPNELSFTLKESTTLKNLIEAFNQSGLIKCGLSNNDRTLTVEPAPETPQ